MQPYTMPLQPRLVEQLVQGQVLRGTLSLHDSCGNQKPGETVNIFVTLQQPPVKPTDFVVLTVGVVVPLLTSPHLVPHQDHRSAEGEKCYSQEVFYLTVPQSLNIRVIDGPLEAAVPTYVRPGPVTVLLTVYLVVFCIIGDQIVQGKPVMAGDEVYALLCLTLLMAIDVRTGQKTRDKAVYHPVVTLQKTAHVVAKLSIPFFPAITYETADLVESSDVPCFGDELNSRQCRVRFYVPDYRRVFERMPLTIP